jgi:hypothetical protein
MKKLLPLLLCLPVLLYGGASLSEGRREVESLRLAETMGLDAAPGGVLLSLSSAGTGDKSPACYRAAGGSVEDALDALRSSSPEEQLFCGHLQQILLGEAYARAGLEGFLSAVCRSSDLRLDMPVFLLVSGSASEAMAAVGGGENCISDVLRSLSGPGDKSADRFSTAGSILRDLERQHSGLIRALQLEDSSRKGEEGGMTAVPAGYGVLADGALRTVIDQEDAVAVELLTETLRPCPLVLRLENGSRITLELQESSLRLRPVWDGDGALSGLDLSLQVQAAVLETDDFDPVAEEALLSAIRARLESELRERVGRVLRLSRSLEADFLGLGRRLEQLAPRRCRGLDQALGPLLPSLTLSVSIQGNLRHGNDML